jgi:membrane protein YqaA with SNARE-associated domain
VAKPTRTRLYRVLGILLVVGISVGIFLIPQEELLKLEGLGYLGVFLIAVVGYATIFLPAPVAIVVFSMGARLSPLGVALAAAVGASLGELSSYLAGFSGQAVVENTSVYHRMVEVMKRYGGVAVLVLAAIPNPLFDLSGIAAGALRMPMLKFLGWCVVGQTLKMSVIAFAGAGLIAVPWVSNLVE